MLELCPKSCGLCNMIEKATKDQREGKEEL